MPKITEFPKLRSHSWTDKDGTRKTAYYFDMRGTGKADIALGLDLELAREKWRVLVAGGTIPDRKAGAKLKPLQAKRRRVFEPNMWLGVPPWAKRIYLSAERRSVARARPVFLTVDEFRAVLKRSDGRCELTGLPLDCEGAGRRPMAPSIDRIDSAKGYVAGNVRIVCLMANQAMSEWGAEPVVTMAKALAQTS
jgi:hypothetical protein